MTDAAETDRPKVLIVDDDPVNREIFRWALEPLCCLTERVNGIGVADHIWQTRPSMVFLDLMMPIVDGFEVIEELRALDPDLLSRVVVVTAAMDHPKAEAINAAGDVPVHLRPYDDAEIVQLYQKYLQ